MFKPLVIGGPKLLCANDARIRKKACAVSESTDPLIAKYFLHSFATTLFLERRANTNHE
jgi:hypothetical protein